MIFSKWGVLRTNIPKHKISQALLHLVSVFIVFGLLSLIFEHLGFYLLTIVATAFCYLLSLKFIILSKAKKNGMKYLLYLLVIAVLIALGIALFR
ncbi:MAG: hypothetical protein COB85_00480 [Bacteroidetes bacterium]|nr:MAG: hypothetical protein COB85_00480 [Bacteroidota bacterium]